MSEFNILDCFDDNIDNIDLTKNYIYVLKLIEDRYYVGRTSNILRRMEEHFTNNGAVYTKAYKPIKVIEVEEEKSRDDERIKTLQIMEKYGWEKVRGACWCCLELFTPPKINNKKNKPRAYKIYEKPFIIDNNDLTLEQLYCIENKDIIEIGNELNKTPGQIAYRLEKLCIIKQRQNARGYYSYINSEMYREICRKSNTERNNKNRLENEVNESINTIKKDINELKFDVLQIKKLIREKYLTAI